MTRAALPFASLQVPPFMASSCGLLLCAQAPLSADEQASIEPMATARLAEFSQGRWHARNALRQLGLSGASLPMAADRSPAWPQGFVGSISHVPPSREHCGQVLAVAARASDCAGLGVDLERTGGLQPEHWLAFLTDSELGWLSARPRALRDALAHGLWSAKEAVMKALRRPMDPQDLEIRMLGDARSFVAQWQGAGGTQVSGWLCFEPGWVAALATVQGVAHGA